jgi:hypothetical protein
MTIDKRINYVAQDGVKNYVKNSPSVTVPKKFKARKNAPATKLAYITADEAKMLKKMKKGTPHKGPKGIPSYDSFDADGNFTSGAAMSAMESGSTNARDRREVQASNYGASRSAGPGVKTQAEQDLRSSVIAAGAGQRVNPGFFDDRNTVSPYELAAARAFDPIAFRKNRSGGIMDFIKSGGILGNLVRGIGQKVFGFGKRYNEPTYNMSQFNNLGFVTDRRNPNYYNDTDNQFINEVSDIKPIQEFKDQYTEGSIPFNPAMNVGYGTGIEELVPDNTTTSDLAIQVGGTVGNYAQNAVSNQLYGKDYRVLDPFTQQQIDKLIEDVGTKSTGELASGTKDI